MRLEVKIPELENFKRNLARAPQVAAREFDKALKGSAYALESEAKKEAPVNKQSGGGNLRQSIRANFPRPLTAVVGVGAKYGLFVHEGTRPHKITVRNKSVLANKKTGQVFGRTVNHPGTKANPFLKRSIDNRQDYITRQFIRANEAIIKSI